MVIYRWDNSPGYTATKTDAMPLTVEWIMGFDCYNTSVWINVGSRWSGDWHSWGGSFWILLRLLILIHEEIYIKTTLLVLARDRNHISIWMSTILASKCFKFEDFSCPLVKITSHISRQALAKIRCSENHWMVGPSLSFDHRSSLKVTH